MLDWILIHFRGVLDWLAVFIFVYALVFLIQFMGNFYGGPDPDDGDE